MINLSYNDGVTFVFDGNDWYDLRVNHRIIGELVGSTTKNNALPLALSVEETILLVKNGIGRLCQWNKQNNVPTEEDKKIFDLELEKLYEDEKIVLKIERKKQIEGAINKIILGKKKKGQENFNVDELIQSELDKLEEVKRENMVTQICTKQPEYLKGNYTEIPIECLYKYTSKTKIAVFEDLWNKGYYLTTGRKFGCDFLVYLGDPVMFHAMFLVKCVEDADKLFSVPDVIAFGRLGNSVKKKSVLANLTPDGNLKYVTVSWIDSKYK